MSILQEYDVRKTGNLELFARQVVEGFIIGLHKSPFHGFSVEFAEHRIYNPGEATKNIDWKVFARTDKLFAKQFEEETNLRCQIVIDCSSSMYFPTSGLDKGAYLNKLSFSALSAASIMHLLQKQRDAFGLSLFAEDLEVHTHCKSNNKHKNMLYAYLDQVLTQQPKNKTTSTAKNLHLIAEAIHKRSLVIIFSDMFDQSGEIEDIFAALQHLKYNKHEVVLFHTFDKNLEENFEFENRPYIFVDLETGEKVSIQSNQVKTYYKEQIAKYKKQLHLKCLQYKIDYVEADITKGFEQILVPYLVKRQKMM